MGLIVALLKGSTVEDVFLDLQDAKVTEKEQEIFDKVQAVLDNGEDILQRIEQYKDAQDLARKAMSSNTQENEEKAFLGLVDCVEDIRRFHDHAKEMEGVLPELLLSLATPTEEKDQSLQDQQALTRQLALLFDFTLRFDQQRIATPNLPNDFSYYRRLLQKFSKHPKVTVGEDAANAMSMFTALHNPMMNSMANSTASTLNNNPHVTVVLSTMANACYSMLRSKTFEEEKAEVKLLCARAMTGSIVLYDHVDPIGAFHRKCPIATKDCITLLKKQFPEQDALLKAIQYSTRHFHDDTTPSSIRALFE